MPKLQVLHTTPSGARVSLPASALHTIKRIQEGDATCGWSGDKRMYVVFNQLDLKYEIWRACEDGKSRIIVSWKPEEFDARVLRHLGEHDLWHVDVLGRIEKQERAIQKAQEEELSNLEKELADDTAWMRKKLYLPGEDAPRPS